MQHDRSAANAGGERTSVLETTTASFVELRQLLFSVVYNLLGSVADTEDVLQETWLAWASSGGARSGSPTRAPTWCGSR